MEIKEEYKKYDKLIKEWNKFVAIEFPKGEKKLVQLLQDFAKKMGNRYAKSFAEEVVKDFSEDSLIRFFDLLENNKTSKIKIWWQKWISLPKEREI